MSGSTEAMIPEHVAGRGRPRSPAGPVRLLVALLAAATVLALLPADTPAAATTDPVLTGRYAVAPGIVREVYDYRTSRGPVSLQLLRFRRDDPRVTFTPELGHGGIARREPVHHTLRRLGDDAVAAVNGTFSYADGPGPNGEPHGLFVKDGAYISEAEKRYGRGWRGGAAFFPDGRYEVGFPDYAGTLTQPDGATVPIGGLNRHPTRPNAERPQYTEVTVIDAAFGARTGTPAGTTEIVLRDVELDLNLEVTRAIAAVSTVGDVAIPADGVVLAVSGQLGRRFANLRPGEQLQLHLASSIPWAGAQHALAAGPLIVRDGAVTPVSSWNLEGFGARHNDNAHPRTIVGMRDGTETLLVTVDGRQSGYSVGLTTAEAAHLMQHLDARDALMIDGGGATTMAIDGRITNRPCCDSPGYRAVSNALVLRSTVTVPNVPRLADFVPASTARRAALEGWPDGSTVAVLTSNDRLGEALVAGTLASKHDAPLLLTAPGQLAWSAAQALQELRTREVLVVGGPEAVSDAVLDELRRRGMGVSRVAGEDAVATAAAVARRVGAPGRHAYLATTAAWPDALSATLPAGREGAPVLLTARDELPRSTADALAALGVRRVTVLGGGAAISDAVASDLRRRGYGVSRIAGADRYVTSTKLTNASGLTPDRVVIVGGDDPVGALVAGPFAVHTGTPLLLADWRDLGQTPTARAWLRSVEQSKAIILSNRASISTWIAHQLNDVLPDSSLALPAADTSRGCPDGRVPRADFTDTDNTIHRAAIDCVVWWEVARGTGSRTYSPGLPVTRDQMASFIANLIEAAGTSLPRATDQGFSDIRGNTHERRINQLAAAGVVSGSSAGAYHPRDQVTREQMATFLVRAYRYVTGEELRGGDSPFGDTVRSTHRANIDAAAAAGFTSGTGIAIYDPGGQVRRDQMASFLARTLDRIVASGRATPP